MRGIASYAHGLENCRFHLATKLIVAVIFSLGLLYVETQAYSCLSCSLSISICVISGIRLQYLLLVDFYGDMSYTVTKDYGLECSRSRRRRHRWLSTHIRTPLYVKVSTHSQGWVRSKGDQDEPHRRAHGPLDRAPQTCVWHSNFRQSYYRLYFPYFL